MRKRGSNPCKPECTCGRHSIALKRDSSAAARKGWNEKRREAARAYQHGTKNSLEDNFIKVVKGYHNAHGAVAASRGSAKTHKCVVCNKQAWCWALNHKNIRDISNVFKDPEIGYYSVDVFDYLPLCGSCHRRYDNL